MQQVLILDKDLFQTKEVFINNSNWQKTMVLSFETFTICASVYFDSMISTNFKVTYFETWVYTFLMHDGHSNYHL